MQQLISFFLRHKGFLLFLGLFCISIALTIQSHSYHKSKFINATNSITGGVYNSTNSFSEFINLQTYNKQLVQENSRLREKLSNYSFQITKDFSEETPFEIVPAKLIQNSFHKKKNILVINKGNRDGIKKDMGVITSNGIVGIIESVGKNYATVLSILHVQSSINAQLKKSDEIGPLSWDGKSTTIVQLDDISKVANITVNDTIVTGKYSTFPQGIQIGKVVKTKLDTSQNYFEIDVQLFNDMRNIGHVYVVKNKAVKEINNLLKNSENE